MATAGQRVATHQRLLPFWDSSRSRRLFKVATWLAAIALLVAALELVGVDVRGWLSHLWNAVTAGSIGYQLVGFLAQTVQTTLTALAWYFILRAGFPGAPIEYKEILAAYAIGVAMNSFLPANIGTVVTLLMYAAIIPRANLAAILGAAAVQKIFFAAASAFVYVYLFASVPGSFGLHLGGPHDHPIRTALIVVGAVVLIVVAGRVLWPKLQEAWEEAKRGGAILAHPREYAVRVVLPSLGAWVAKAGVIAAFLASYGITVSFHALMAVMAGNSIGHTVSLTPGGVGVNQATNVAALHDSADAANAAAYSLGQQFSVTAWNIAFALAVLIWAFGWAGGKALVERSYADARAQAKRGAQPAKECADDYQ